MGAKKRDKSILPWLAAALGFILLFVTLMGFGIISFSSFRNFKKNLQADVDYVQDGWTLEYTVNGERQTASYHTPDAILFALSETGPGKRFKGEIPAERDRIAVSFGNGSRLTIYSTDVRDGDGSTSPGILVTYSSASGKTYSYDTDRIILSKIKTYITQFEK